MLFEFIDLNREEIVTRTRERVRGRAWPSVSDQEIEHGVPLFLTQLADTLRLETTAEPFSSDAVGATATRHGAELLAAGFNVAQVVHDYGDICQAVTEIAIEQHAPITVEEFHTLNRCLDTAIAEAVTEHTRLVALKRSEEEVERLGQAAHELRNLLNAALLAFHALKRGMVAINGNTGAVLGGT
jgi:signal transduction histidine kinase